LHSTLIRLFLSLPVHPLHLRPFPTRRSSDLVTSHWYPYALPPAARISSTTAASSSPRRASRNTTAPLSATAMAAARPMPEEAPVDRKSTRLNSSHVKISYAVFCLKKKSYDDT